MFCSACAAPAPEAARFCSACGASLSAVPTVTDPVSREERRVVTVVFCDLVGSTALSGHLDPEVLRSVTLRYFELMRASLTAHGGTVEKFIGDAVMAVFGVPQMHEDDARRALAATLDMTAALVGFNAELEVNLGIRLDVRIGVNTGEVIAATEASAGQALVSGEVVNVAARLEQCAEAGQILIGPDTLAAAGPAAVVRKVGPLRLKGKADTVVASELLELLADDPALSRRFDVPFIGREPELAELDLILERTARQRSCHLVTLYGEAGIGKTRLIRGWQQALSTRPASGSVTEPDGARTEPDGARIEPDGTATEPDGTATKPDRSVLLGAGRCRPYGDAGTLTALAEAIRQLLEEAPGDMVPLDALELLRTGLLKDGTPHPSVSETVTAVAAVVAGLAGQATVALVFDDCHWAPQVLLDVLDELAEFLDLEPVLLVCLARPELLDGRPGWGSGRLNASSMVLQGLSTAESALLAAELVEVSSHDAATCERILKRAEGNPLHLEQLFAALADGSGQGPLPPTVHALLAARVDALETGERQLLDLAAIIGREFDAAGLAAFAEPMTGESGSLLRSLARRRLVEPARTVTTGRRPYRFTSGLVQEVAYQAMAKRVRAERHQRYSEILLAAGRPDTVASTAEVASHLERAYRYRAELGLLDGDTERLRTEAAAELGSAGVAAFAHADLCWADDLLARGLKLLKPAEPSWPRLALHSADVQLALGRREAGLALLLRARDASALDPVTAAHARLQLATHDPAKHGSPAEAARAALPVFEEAHDQLGLARAGIRIAQQQQFQGRHGQAEQTLLAAVQRAVAAGAQPEQGVALGAIGVSLWRGPTPAVAAISRCQQLLAEHGPGRAPVRVTLNCPLAVLLALQDRFSEARDCLRLAGPLARSLGYAEAEVFMPLFTATVAGLAGEVGEAETLLRGALRACDRIGIVSLDAAVARDLARLLLDRGAGQEAGTLTDRLTLPGLDLNAELAPSEAADLFGIHARIESEQGHPTQARALAEQAVAHAGHTDSPLSRGTAELDRAYVLTAGGDGDEARSAALTAVHWFQQKGHLAGVRLAAELADGR